jgi:NADH dehydrogenase
MHDRLITVFGASGFLGRYAVRALAKAGYRVRAAVRHTNTANFLKPMGHVGQIQVMQANVRVRPTIERALEGAWGVVNLVGILRESGPQRFGLLHGMVPGMIAQIARESGAKSFVHVSAIGASADSPSAYARSKFAGEENVKREFPQAVILRPSLAFGPEDEFFNRFAGLIRSTWFLPFPVFGGGTTKFQPVFSGDVADAVATAIGDPKYAGRTFELGGPLVYTFRELIEEILKVTERQKLLVPVPWIAAKAMAAGGMLVPDFLMKPLITLDQVKQLQIDNVVTNGGAVGTIADLGISPHTLEAELPGYLWRFRKSGQFEVSGLA